MNIYFSIGRLEFLKRLLVLFMFLIVVVFVNREVRYSFLEELVFVCVISYIEVIFIYVCI